MTNNLYDKLQAMIGVVSEIKTGNDKVNEAMTRHWCEAIEDDNPLYTNEQYARASEYGGIIMPPTMIQAYCVPVLWPEITLTPDPLFKAVQMCVEDGYSATVGVSYSYEFFRPMYPGNQISFTLRIVSVSPEKTTRLGTGFFVTAGYSYVDQENKAICEQLISIFQYNPLGSDKRDQEVANDKATKTLE
ncbi:MAG: MaoC family dehydratase [Planctomycetes bacterium]|nr:MaoC family dehydratase [Planctomycetota bacterium]